MTVATEIDLQQANVLSTFPMPMTFRPPTPLSDDELIAFAERNECHHIERNAAGELEIMMSPGNEGSYFELDAGGQLWQWAREHGGRAFGSNGGFSLADGSMRIPDAAWVSDAQWNALSKRDRQRYSPISPEFLIEILSLTDSRKGLEAKMQQWIANGVQLAWMIDPYRKSVSIYRPNVEVEVLDHPSFVEAGEPVTGFRLSTERLWDE